MTVPATDRRVQRTRKVIKDALVSLILEKGYEKVTVQDIIDRANIGRSTFYAHYQDKEDLLLRGVAEIAYGPQVDQAVSQHLVRLEQDGLDGSISTLPMFAHVRQNELMHKAMFEHSKENSILEKGTEFLYANTKAQLTHLAGGRQPSVPIPLLASFLTGGLMALVKWWLANDMSPSPEEMDRTFQQIAMPGVRRILGGGPEYNDR